MPEQIALKPETEETVLTLANLINIGAAVIETTTGDLVADEIGRAHV